MYDIFSELPKRLLDDENYLRVDKLRSWVESILDKVLGNLPKEKNFHSFTVDDKTYYVSILRNSECVVFHRFNFSLKKPKVVQLLRYTLQNL